MFCIIFSFLYLLSFYDIDLHYDSIITKNRSPLTLISNLFEINFIPSWGCFCFSITNDAIINITLNILLCSSSYFLIFLQITYCVQMVCTLGPWHVSPNYPAVRIYVYSSFSFSSESQSPQLPSPSYIHRHSHIKLGNDFSFLAGW